MYKKIGFLVLSIISCKTEKLIHYSDTITMYEVEYKGASLVIDKMNFKETKIFDEADRLIAKKSYDISGNPNGQKDINYKDNMVTSEYRRVDNTLSLTYKYQNYFLLEMRSLDGSNNQLFRTKQHNYNGNQT